ncbi:MAG: C-GCAxxG-C-C family protein [Clostridiales bacterium]|nr:C-GCAxxG-C-C family protein [Clostridiales bacterium]
MTESAVSYLESGCNCSQCVVMAAGDFYGLRLPEEIKRALTGVTAGFGAGSACSALVGAVIVFGLLMDEYECKRARITLLSEFARKYGAINCAALRKTGMDCKEFIAGAAGLAEGIIRERQP